MYTRGSKSLPHLPNVCTDDGSLDMSLPVQSHQHTEPDTSVVCEGEVNADKGEIVLTTSVTVYTPEHHRMWALCIEDT